MILPNPAINSGLVQLTMLMAIIRFIRIWVYLQLDLETSLDLRK
jgi:hypothetical protein